MAKKIDEIDEIFSHLNQGNNFLLSGGAGSGKTYSLVQVLNRIYSNEPTASIACITFTNTAVNQIKSRFPHTNLRASTIHDFLWSNISGFQKNLKLSLIALAAEGTIQTPDDVTLSEEYFTSNDIKQIAYKEWKDIKNGIVSHDEVIVLAEHMYNTHIVLCNILKDKYKYILVDEYQDCTPGVIGILLDSLQKSQKKNIIGFFGDSMQSIYPDVVGDIKEYVDSGVVREVIKRDNRRNPKKVIQLANKIRVDGLVQNQASDIQAPNYQKEGDIKFLYSSNLDFDSLKHHTVFSGWDFGDPKKTKELYLTQNLIAVKAGFKNLMEIYDKDRIISYKNRIMHKIREEKIEIPYNATFGEVIDIVNLAFIRTESEFIKNNKVLFETAKKYSFEAFSKIFMDKDLLIGDKRTLDVNNSQKGLKKDNLMQHLFKIQNNIFLYEQRKYNEFIQRTEYKIKSIEDKRKLKKIIEDLGSMKNQTIESVIDFADANGICKKDDNLNGFITEKEYVFNRVKPVKYVEICNAFSYCEGHTLFSTQHNIKGEEYNNVLAVLDNGRWPRYNFEYLFTNEEEKESIIETTRKIFYVCCTRVKENLVVVFNRPSEAVLKQAKIWFGEENVIKI